MAQPEIGIPVALLCFVEKHEPHATFLNGRYRLDRLVVEHDDVTIWSATDLARGQSVQLSVFERGRAVLHQGAIGAGMFVVVDKSSAPPPQLEIVDDGGDVASFEEPSPRRRSWPWAAAGLACALLASAGWYVVKGPSRATSETTITEARIPAPEVVVPAPVVQPAVKVPEPPRVVETPPVAQPQTQPQPQVQRRETPVQRPILQLQKPKPVKPRPQPSSAAAYDPLTI